MRMTNTVRYLVGTLGSLIFVLAVLSVIAPEVQAADDRSCWTASGSLFYVCADLDTSSIDDRR